MDSSKRYGNKSPTTNSKLRESVSVSSLQLCTTLVKLQDFRITRRWLSKTCLPSFRSLSSLISHRLSRIWRSMSVRHSSISKMTSRSLTLRLVDATAWSLSKLWQRDSRMRRVSWLDSWSPSWVRSTSTTRSSTGRRRQLCWTYLSPLPSVAILTSTGPLNFWSLKTC